MGHKWRLLRQFPGLLASGVGLALRSEDPSPLRLALQYARLETKALVFRAFPARAPSSERVLGWDIAFSHYPTLAYLFRDVFLTAPYRVPAGSPDPVIVDCGANIGMSVLYFRRRYPRARITAFEPDPNAFELLQENLRRNGAQDVQVHQLALGGEDGVARFFHDPGRPASVHGGIVGRPGLGASREVQIRRLSTLLPARVDILKLDVEGVEGDVIRELSSAGALDNIQSMVLELHHRLDGHTALGEILTGLERAGFEYHLATAEDQPVLAPDSFQDILVHAYRSGDV